MECKTSKDDDTIMECQCKNATAVLDEMYGTCVDRRRGSCQGGLMTVDRLKQMSKEIYVCDDVSGDVIIRGLKDADKPHLRIFEATQVIHGSLIVENNEMIVFDSFPSLEHVGNKTYTEPSISIIHNSFLSIYFPNLTDNLYSKRQKVVFLVKDNEKLVMTVDQIEWFQYMSGDYMGEPGGEFFIYDKMIQPPATTVPPGVFDGTVLVVFIVICALMVIAWLIFMIFVTRSMRKEKRESRRKDRDAARRKGEMSPV